MFDRLKRLFPPPLEDDVLEGLRANARLNSAGFDPWGLHLDTAERAVRWLRPLYRYFRAEAHGIDRVPEGRVLIVPNHSGQIPFDGMMIALAMLLEARPPRVVRGMVERWFPTLPFISTLFTRCGQVVGDPQNCLELLRHEQAIMVFPEGVRGSGKTYEHSYQLQEFGTGFMRIALETESPVVPVAVVGAEETYPSLYNAALLAKLLGTPYIPITPFFPLLGPLGALPLPFKIDLYFGEPIRFEGDPDEPDAAVQDKIDRVKATIEAMIEQGLRKRPAVRKLRDLVGVTEKKS